MRIDLGQLEFIDPQLRELATGLEKEFGIEFTVTSIYRIGDSGVHGMLPVRGLDLRMRDHGLGKCIESYINARWKYDSSRPHLSCCLLHGENSNMHLHLQVHPNTTRI